MKKRKSPAILISTLVILFGVVAVINGFVTTAADPEAERTAAMAKAQMEAERNAPDATQASLAEAASKGVAQRKQAPVGMGATDRSKLVRDKGTAPRKKSLDAGVSSQWYAPEADKSGKF